MKGQVVRGELERVGDGSSGHAFWSRFDKKAKDIKTIVLRESGQSRQSMLLLHVSTNIEISAERQGIFQGRLK
jgi:hypothetical protein